MSDSASSSGYSSFASSGNASPEINCTQTTTAEDGFFFQDQDERLRRSIESVRNNSGTSLSVIINNELNNVPESVKQIARDLADDVIHHVVGIVKRKPSSKHAETLRRTAEDTLTRHEIFFKNVACKMQIDRNTAHATFKNVADDMLSDGVYNWGRIVALYTFGARLAQHCYVTSKESNEQLVSDIATFVGNYIAEKLAVWINMNGGWDAFDEQFPSETRFEDVVKKGLIITALGLGALASVILAR